MSHPAVPRHPGVPTHWLATADPDPFPTPENLPAEVDAVVIGGGLMGVATAYWLARRGQSVLLVEARRLAWGASGRNAGIFLAGLHPVEDPALLRSVLAREDIDAGFERTGHLCLAASDTVFDQVRAEVARRPAGAPLHAVDLPTCEEILRMRIAAEFAGGRWAPDGHVIHPVKLVHGLAAAAARRGGQVATRTRVDRVVPGRRRRLRVHTSRGAVDTTHVVHACGSAVTRFRPGLRAVFTPTRGQVLATGPLPPLFGPAMAVDFGRVYWRQARDGTIVIGGCRDVAADPETGTTRERLNPVIQRALAAFLPRAFPGFPAVTVRRRWAGIMDQTADGRPLVGPVPDPIEPDTVGPDGDGQWVIAGFGGHGVPAAVGAGRALAEAMTAGGPSPLLTPFDPRRFDPALSASISQRGQ